MLKTDQVGDSLASYLGDIQNRIFTSIEILSPETFITTGFYGSSAQLAKIGYKVPPLTISPIGGSYDNSLNVDILGFPDPLLQIHYTMDGTGPTQSSPLFTGPVYVNHHAFSTQRDSE